MARLRADYQPAEFISVQTRLGLFDWHPATDGHQS
jgi:hypothetical protein